MQPICIILKEKVWYSRNMKKFLIALVIISTIGIPFIAVHAQELRVDITTTTKAKVLEVLSNEQRENAFGSPQEIQIIKVEILKGEETGKILTLENDYIQLQKGDIFYLRKVVRAEDGFVVYAVSDPYRLPSLIFFTVLFIVLVVVFGGVQGVRGLLSLVASLWLIVYLLLPGIMEGFSPILVSLGAASLIIILGSYVTHGFNKTTTIAVVGMVATIIITGFLAWAAVHFTHLTGLGDEEAVYLNFNTQGRIDFLGLLLGGILIGLLGVLYDAAISQAIVVEELYRAAPHLGKTYIFKRAMRIGKEHIGALVNNLAIAYVGSSMPLLLLYLTGPKQATGVIINQEIFATEIIRIMIGSIGLVLAVPITTYLSVMILVKKNTEVVSSELLFKEKQALEHAGHHH